MKKIFFLLILINSISCKKGWLEYTNKYTGNFQFTVEQTYYNPLTGVSSNTTYVYNGTIKKIRRGEIKIKYGSKDNNFYDVEIDKDGDFSEGYLSGKFSDKNNLTISYKTGGNGGGGWDYVTGIRR